MRKIYANLLGEWTDITENGTVEDSQDPTTYFKEMLCYRSGETTPEAFKYEYINVQFEGKNYRIHPSCIQIVD